ncbi:hypothetical protein BMF94_6869 [Rhodotorula taiwanensis]|uniref:RRM domain-containing protein n=1 Tax=Rhodotorula taiwanensis TaxID=741276 RepID=A0A2S5B011_9BASI|nr:hypothetical protein BMF94_6869 [Rhodotorula taiwanensis]
MPRSQSPARSYSRSPSRSRSPTPNTADTVRITKLTKNVTSVHLEEIFDVYGKIVDIDLPVNKRLGTHKGTAWVTFASPAAAAKAADYMDSAQVDGSVISVVIEPPSPRVRHLHLEVAYQVGVRAGAAAVARDLLVELAIGP